MAVKVLKNVLVGAASVLVLDPGPVPTVSETRKKLREVRVARKLRSKSATQLAKSAVQFACGYAERAAAQTVAGVEKLVDAHPKSAAVRKKTGQLQLLVFRIKPRRTDAATTG